MDYISLRVISYNPFLTHYLEIESTLDLARADMHANVGLESWLMGGFMSHC